MAPERWPCAGCTGRGTIQRPRMGVSLKERTQEVQPLPQACVALWILALPPRLGSALVCSPMSLNLPQRQPCERADFESKTLLPMGLARTSYTWSRDLLRFLNKFPIDRLRWESRQDIESQDRNLWAKDFTERLWINSAIRRERGQNKRVDRFLAKNTHTHTEQTNNNKINHQAVLRVLIQILCLFSPNFYYMWLMCPLEVC